MWKGVWDISGSSLISGRTGLFLKLEHGYASDIETVSQEVGVFNKAIHEKLAHETGLHSE